MNSALRRRPGGGSPVRFVGAAFVFVACVLLTFDGRWNARLASLPGPGEHGIHALDALGFLAAATGVGILWTAARGRNERR